MVLITSCTMRRATSNMDNQRKALVLLTLLALCQPLLNGRKGGNILSSAPVFLPVSQAVQIKISGDVARPGIYQLPANNMAESVIAMAKPECRLDSAEIGRHLPLQLVSGDAVIISCDGNKTAGTLKIGKMKGLERITLKIPLDLARVTEEELTLLPGVGAALARRIVEFRHKNGGFSSSKELLQVEGVGEKKLKILMEYLN